MNIKKKRKIYLIVSIVSGITCGGAFILWAYRIFYGLSFINKDFTFINFIVFMLSCAIFNLTYGQYKKLNAGVIGEEITQGIIDFLPDTYQKLSNIKIEYNGQRCEIDSLVISEKGICIIEVKNYRGYICGDEKDSQWIQQKTSAKGNTYESTIRNPIKQVNRQAYILSQLLKDNGMNCWINTFVFMIGCECDVSSNKVFTDERDLLDEIMETGKDNSLSQRDIEMILRLLGE